MRKNRVYFMIVGMLIGCYGTYAQANLLNAKTVDSIGVKTQAQIESDNDEPLEYGYIDDRDILWAKTTWERIDLNQRVNLPLLFPIDENSTSKARRPLFDVIIDAVRDSVNGVTMYADSYFRQKFPMEQLETNLRERQLTDAGIEAQNAGEEVAEWMYETAEVQASDVSAYLIRGYWYFDKRQGELRYRLLAICPEVVSAQNKLQKQQNPDMEIQPVQLFWVYYPELRNDLHKALVFNSKNTSQPITFDHLLNSRRFDATIYKEDNVYGDRQIDDYVADNSLMQLLESERIKESIRNFESDMWNY